MVLAIDKEDINLEDKIRRATRINYKTNTVYILDVAELDAILSQCRAKLPEMHRDDEARFVFVQDMLNSLDTGKMCNCFGAMMFVRSEHTPTNSRQKESVHAIAKDTTHSFNKTLTPATPGDSTSSTAAPEKSEAGAGSMPQVR